ncbi:MAG: ABC transporter ATP-binding protein [Desulfuromonadales bacterium]|nr:ABC transporter ATP-binding protein [Desulfuromonadales bacterium]
MTDGSGPLIRIAGVNKSFISGPGRVDVLHDINLDISRGERVAIVGPSGAGKTTLMHILGGLDRPSTGTVHFSGKEIFSFKGQMLDEFRNRTIGFVFQFNQLLPEFTALENVMMPALIARLPKEEALARATALLGEVGLSHRLRHKPGELSGGEQQRTAIARALIMNPPLLLADEPSGNLDSVTSGEILALLDGLHQARKLTMVIVTHSDTLANRLDRIVRVIDGRIAAV